MADDHFTVVSSESEELILVTDKDEEIGFLSKAACHDGEGILHRAFSIFLFDGEDRILLQQRSASKRLWGGFWSNSCCSHPRRGENLEEALHRRLREELGMDADLRYLFTFSYHALFQDLGAEKEVCSVWAGRTSDTVNPNTSEIQDLRWLSVTELNAEISDTPEIFTPWFLEEWPRVLQSFPLSSTGQ